MDRDEMIENLLTKAVSEILPSRDYVQNLLKTKKLTIYLGVDPTGETLHIGHTVQLRKLREFQELGHKIVYLVGDFTARIGDPTDKGATRKQLSEKEIKTNLKLYKKQASKFINFSGKNSAKIVFNSQWLNKMRFSDVINLSSKMTVDQMLKRDMFTKRIEEGKPIYIHEFMYPLMQGYDSVVLEVDGEVGGNDQLFNMMTGRALLKQIKNKEKFVITTKLLLDSSGAKMGKTTGNMVSLKDIPTDIYGKVMSWSDDMIVSGFELCTNYTMSQISNIENELNSGINPRDIKMRLAYEITKSCTDEKSAQKAEEDFISIFQEKKVVEEIKETQTKNRTFEQILLDEKIVESKSELRRLIGAGAVSNFETKEKMIDMKLREVPAQATYKIGKNRFIKII